MRWGHPRCEFVISTPRSLAALKQGEDVCAESLGCLSVKPRMAQSASLRDQQLAC